MLIWYLLLVVPAYFLLIVSANVAVSFVGNFFLQDFCYIAVNALYIDFMVIVSMEKNIK